MLTQLVDKSLVAYEEQGGEGRYRLLETVRQYSRDRLLESGEEVTVRGQHRDWFVRLAEQGAPELWGPNQSVWFDRLAVEHDNLRTALAWGQRAADGPEAGLRLAGALSEFWAVRGHWQEGTKWLSALLAQSEPNLCTAGRAKALFAAGDLAWRQGEYERAASLSEESQVLFHRLGDKSGIADCLGVLSDVALGQGDFERAERLAEERLALSRQLGDKRRIAWSLCVLGVVAGYRGHQEREAALLEEGLTVARQAGEKRAIAFSLHELGQIAMHQGKYERAAAFGQESITLFREAQDKYGMALALSGLGQAAQRQGDDQQSAARFAEAMALSRELGDKIGMAAIYMDQGHELLERGDAAAARARYEEGLALRRTGENTGLIAWALLEIGHVAWLQAESDTPQSHAVEALERFHALKQRDGIIAALESLAVAALTQGQKERAARLLGAAEAGREALGLPRADRWRRPRERIGEAARAASLEQEFAAAWAEGRAMPLDQATAYALGERPDA